MTSSSPSPLSEANSASLDEFFARKPPYDSETLARIKAEFRRMREVWAKADSGEKVRAKKVAKSPVTKSVGDDIFDIKFDPTAGPGESA